MARGGPRATKSRERYDGIVVGSGVGGLCAAAILAKNLRHRVLVLEQHSVLGGFTHQFRRSEGRSWDVGLHYVGELGDGSPGRALFDYVGEGQLRWRRMSDPTDRFFYPGLQLAVNGSEDQYRATLQSQFPHERSAIARYFKDVRRAAKWGTRHFAACLPSGVVGRMLRRMNGWFDSLALQSTADYLDARFRDPVLRAVLASRWRLHGLDPQRSAFLTHAIVTRHYWNGGYYPEGGSASIARAIAVPIERAGGALRTRHAVTGVRVEGGRAIGVEVRSRSEGRDHHEFIASDYVISNVGADATYRRLLTDDVADHARRELETLGVPPTAVSLYLGLRDSPRSLGLDGANLWISDRHDHSEANEFADCCAGQPSGCFVSFPTLKGSDSRRHTAEILTFCSYESFVAYRDRAWRKRGADYEALKDRIATGLLDLVERHVPGFKGLVEYAELSTPLTVEHFTGHQGGAVYGLPATPARFRRRWPGARTPIENLHLAGSDTFFHGILGAAMGGVAAAGHVVGPFGFFRAMAAAFADRRRPRGAAHS